MGSNIDLRIISIAVAISILTGLGTGYMVGNSPLTSLIEEKDLLETEYASLDVAFQSLEDDLNSTQGLLVEEQIDNELLRERYMEMLAIDRENQVLKQQVIDLESEITSLQNLYQDILNMTIIQDYTQSIEYNLSAGTERTWEFLIPKHGIIWEAKISFSGTKVSMSHSWRRGDERVFVGSSGISLTYTGSADLVYYGIQENLWGTITVDYYLDERDPNKLWVTGSITSNLPTISRSAIAYIDIP